MQHWSVANNNYNAGYKMQNAKYKTQTLNI